MITISRPRAAETGSETVVEWLDMGANDFMAKPLDIPVLVARIYAHLRTADAGVACG